MTLAQAMLRVGSKLPNHPDLYKRLNRAYDMVRNNGSGYQIEKVGGGEYQIFKASTSLLEDNSAIYDVTKTMCTCPDYPKAPSNLCKHRLAVMLVEAMQRGTNRGTARV